MWIWKEGSDGGIKLVTGDSKLTAITVDNTGSVSFPGGTDSGIQHVDVAITAAQMKALHATPQSLVAAPGAGLANVFVGAIVYLQFGTVAYTIAAGDDLSFKYTDASGLELAQCETTGLLDAGASGTRYVQPHAAASGDGSVTPVANAAIVLNMLSAEVTAGDSVVKVRTYYRVIPTTL